MPPLDVQRLRISLIVILAAFFVGPLWGQGVLIPLPTRHDLAFDHAGKYLYLSTQEGSLRRYNLATGELEAGYEIGGVLNGIDIADDDSFLLVGQGDQTRQQPLVHKVNLITGEITNIVYPVNLGSNIVWDVVILSNGKALATLGSLYGSTLPVLQIDLSTNAITERRDLRQGAVGGAGINSGARLSRSADGKRALIAEGDQGWCFVYDSSSDAFSGPGYRSERLGEINRDGSVVAMSYRNSLSLDSATGFHFLHAFGGLDGPQAFDPKIDAIYAVARDDNQIVAYDSNTYAEKFRFGFSDNLMDRWFEFEGGLVISPDGRYLALNTEAGVRLYQIPRQTVATPRVFQAPSNMVFDHAGNYLYISTWDGLVWPLNLATSGLETPYDCGGIIRGLDIAPDDSMLLAAQSYRGINEGAVQKINLGTGAISNITYPVIDVLEAGSLDVAIASNGRAFFTARIDPAASGQTEIHQIDLFSNAVTTRRDAEAPGYHGYVTGQTHLCRSADYSRLFFTEGNIYSGRMFTYSGTSDSFASPATVPYFLDNTGTAVSRDGSAVALRIFSTEVRGAGDLSVIAAANGPTGGLAFSPVSDVLYGVVIGPSPQIIAYNSVTLSEQFRLNAGTDIPGYISAKFETGHLVASPDGRRLAVLTSSSVRVLSIADNTAFTVPTTAPAKPTVLANISTRAAVRTGDNATIAGFIIGGLQNKKIVVRAIGPSLASAGLQGVLQDTVLELYDQSGSLIASNDDWQDQLDYSSLRATNLAPSNQREAALLRNLAPGAYTALMRGKDDTVGTGLIEVYDADPNPLGSAQLLNISTRGMVGTGDDVMIAGLIITVGPSKVILRGIGPSLSRYQIPNALSDPIIELHDANGTVMALNDNWRDIEPELIWNTGLAPSDDHESALLTILPAGSYTVVLKNRNNTPGVGLVEVYTVQ